MDFAIHSSYILTKTYRNTFIEIPANEIAQLIEINVRTMKFRKDDGSTFLLFKHEATEFLKTKPLTEADIQQLLRGV